MTKRTEWSERLENVLNDGDAVKAFIRWMQNDTVTSEHPINLHFANIAFKKMLADGDKRSARLARDIYNKYLCLERGLCSFLPEEERAQIGQKLERLGDRKPSKDLFEPIIPHVDSFLRSQHALFVRSDEFLEMFNCEQEPSTSAAYSGVPSTMPPPSMPPPHPPRGKSKKAESSAPTLTAELLIRSQQARESALGASAVEKMYPPANKYPYVCMATTSKHDSAVSSSFSSDANGQKVPLKALREEQIRGNPTTHTLARVEKHHDPNACSFKHNTIEGRRAFARLLTDKLKLLLARERNEAHLAQIEQSSMTARDVMAVAWQHDKETTKIEEDDDVEKYVRNRMANDSSKVSSKDSPMVHTTRSRRRSPKSTSPERSFAFNVPQSVMSTSAYNPPHYASNGFAPPPPANHKGARGANQFYRPDDYQYFTSSTSGIGSMVQSSVSGRHDHKRAAIFQRAREMSNGRRRNESSTLPRQKDRSSHITLYYKEGSSAPLVAKVPFKSNMTLKEFRHHLSVSRRNRKFFFRTKCEDGSAPHQLLHISDDSAIVPVFEGSIAAEARIPSDSE
uniref:RGS domain-containing protein n=1 Tax=Steinernema glaseri TaxID=37863 RepID=A0A1I7Y1W9_9BILA